MPEVNLMLLFKAYFFPGFFFCLVGFCVVVFSPSVGSEITKKLWKQYFGFFLLFLTRKIGLQ